MLCTHARTARALDCVPQCALRKRDDIWRYGTDDDDGDAGMARRVHDAAIFLNMNTKPGTYNAEARAGATERRVCVCKYVFDVFTPFSCGHHLGTPTPHNCITWNTECSRAHETSYSTYTFRFARRAMIRFRRPVECCLR